MKRDRMRWLACGTLALVSCLSGAIGALAHPHVWAKAKTSVVFHDGQIIGLRHVWRFDEGFTKGVREEFDKNKDGRLSADELDELVELNMKALRDFNFFTVAKSGSTKVQLDRPSDYSMIQDGNVLVMRFTIGFKAPLARGKPLKFTVEDPTYFTHFEYEGEGGVSLDPEAPKGCRVELEARSKASAEEQRLVEAFTAQFNDATGMLGTQQMARVRCSPAA